MMDTGWCSRTEVVERAGNMSIAGCVACFYLIEGACSCAANVLECVSRCCGSAPSKQYVFGDQNFVDVTHFH